jgi:Crinkler effector protein N-terminal domain
MATIITLLCAVHGDPGAVPFQIDISNYEDVYDLKEKIKKEKENDSRDFDAPNLTLWKVNIPIDRYAAIQPFTLEETGDIEKMLTECNVEDYFCTPAKRHINVIVQLRIYILGNYFYYK